MHTSMYTLHSTFYISKIPFSLRTPLIKALKRR